ncbi:galactose-3-O-sulfotransferase 4-like [Saccostrea echinata]|uniref:galactose-3-O-sulfotransferase 4-like n=1 Tax=Saccostrea echinata TaxID=191078 RepID=UPI002A83B77A|nr:galactose-3-O-sulfotransferase 4-like [Saccostrea echinata]
MTAKFEYRTPLQNYWKYRNTNQIADLNNVSNSIYFPTKQTPNQHIAFLKVHKTGSTTAQGLFLRYGLKRNLTFVVANNKSWFPNIISLEESVIPGYNIIPPPKGKRYEILCFHVVYNRSAFERIMPNDTKYIGIVREPFLHFKSSIRYFNYGGHNGHAQYLRHFLQNSTSTQRKENSNPATSFLNNRMAFEFNFPLHLFDSFSSYEVKQYLEKLDKEFDLVIINEYMDESIVLLRRMLNWDVKDVLFVNLNVNQGTSDLNEIGLKEIHLHRQFATLDYELYHFFLKRLWKQIHSYGHDILEEISYYKLLRKNLENFCNSKETPILIVEESRWSSSFPVTQKDCNFMRQGEFWYLNEIMKQQYS